MVPYVDLKTQYQNIKSEIDEAVLNVLASTRYILGPEVMAFEEEFAAYSNTEYAIAVNSGTSALHLSLLALGIGAGDEVITVPFTFVATVAAIRYTGAKPVFVDIDPQRYTMNPDQVEQAITDKTKAIMPVHLYGQPADMNPILEIAKKHNLPVIEDAAQAHGAEYKGRRAGSMAEIAGFSFYPGKNLGAYGEGGLVTTNDPNYAQKIRLMRDWGQEQKGHHNIIGFNYRMDGIQGAILRVKLRHLEEWTEARRQHALYYKELLQDIKDVTIPYAADDVRHVYHVYALQVPNRDRLQQAFKDNDVQFGVHYPIPVHLQKFYADLGHKAGDFPVSEQVANRVISLPMFPEMTRDQQEQVAKVISDTFQ